VKRYRAHGRRPHGGGCSRHTPDDSALEDLVTLGLHHEQQHQELISPTSSTLLSFNPTHPPMRSAGRSARCSRSRSRWHRLRRRPVDDRPRCQRATGLLLRQRDAAPPRYVAPFELRSRPSATASTSRSWMTAATARRAVAVARLGLGRGRRARAPLYWLHDGGAGSRTRCRASSRSTRTRRCAI
jgi:hypothetical protein